MTNEMFKLRDRTKQENKGTRPYFSIITLLLLVFPPVGLLLHEADGQLHLPTLDEIEQSANAGLDLPTLDEIEQSEYPQAGSSDGWEEIINQGPSESSDDDQGSSESSDDDQGSSESSDGWEDIINQGPPENDFTSSVIEAMENGQIDPSTAEGLVNANNCGINNAASNILGPVIEGGFEITHTDPTCPGMTFNGR